jgi:hypothetical protein
MVHRRVKMKVLLSYCFVPLTMAPASSLFLRRSLDIFPATFERLEVCTYNRVCSHTASQLQIKHPKQKIGSTYRYRLISCFHEKTCIVRKPSRDPGGACFLSLVDEANKSIANQHRAVFIIDLIAVVSSDW